MTVFGPHYDAKHTGFAGQYCYYVKSYYRKSFFSVQPVVKQAYYCNNITISSISIFRFDIDIVLCRLPHYIVFTVRRSFCHSHDSAADRKNSHILRRVLFWLWWWQYSHDS